MSRETVCTKVDEWSFEFRKNSISIVVTIVEGVVCVINPNVQIGEYPLIIYAEVGNAGVFYELIANILRGNRDSMFTDNIKAHMCDVKVCRGNEAIKDTYMRTAKGVLDRYIDLKNAFNFSRAIAVMGGE